MANKWDKGKYIIQNPHKYAGTSAPTYRSSWERKFMETCDARPDILKWASENIKIPYQNPLTGKFANYIPDFMIQYVDKSGTEHVELIEIKPEVQTTLEAAGKSKRNLTEVHVNAAKWAAASEWAQRKGIRFRVITEKHIFPSNKKLNKKRVSKPRVTRPKKR